MLNQLTEAINSDFIEKLSILHKVLKIDFSKYSLHRQGNNKEISFRSFSLNSEYKFAGKYFENNARTLSVWIGYYAEYGFCISFWVKDTNIKNKILNNLESMGYNCLCNYSGAIYKGQEEKYWLNVKLKLISKQDKNDDSDMCVSNNPIQSEIDKIMEAVPSDLIIK